MRFLTILLFFCVISVHSFSKSYAQGNDTDSVVMDAKEASSDKNSPFSKASDEQIKQTQRYYQKCKENETLSKIKDCKCAATSYLETMLELGDNATTENILAANANKCLKDTKAKIDDIDKIDLGEVTEKQIAEAEAAQEWCNSKPEIRSEHDCECVAAKFLEIRVNDGPIIGKDEILSRILIPALCKNIVESTGSAYSKCMKQPNSAFKNVKVEPKEYCECYARKWAEYYENHVGKLGPKTRGNYEFFSRMYCLKDSSYE